MTCNETPLPFKWFADIHQTCYKIHTRALTFLYTQIMVVKVVSEMSRLKVKQSWSKIIHKKPTINNGLVFVFSHAFFFSWYSKAIGVWKEVPISLIWHRFALVPFYSVCGCSTLLLHFWGFETCVGHVYLQQWAQFSEIFLKINKIWRNVQQ